MAFHGEVLVPRGRAAVHHLTPNMLVVMCQAEGIGQDNFLARHSVSVPGLCLEWDAEGHIDESDLKYLQGGTGVLDSPFLKHPLGLAQFAAV